MTSSSKLMSTPVMKALLTTAFLATAVSTASAADWCRINEHNLYSCGFKTKEQCQAMTSGRTGYCDVNPFPGKSAAVQHPVVVYTEAEMAVCHSLSMDCVGPKGASSSYAYAPKSSRHHAE
jgi:hypothetical protein